ncbi:MAG: proline--tRNA ligase [Rickettsiaceae bacterium]|nr:proline--tRNA ligase [Rickettsiaceae bacterium]
MRLSQYFLPLLKENPVEASVVSHSLMLRAGMIRQQCSGIYSWLPLGLKVLNNIQDIVKFNMRAVGCIEILMPCMQPSDLWNESGRFDDYGKEMLKITDRHDNQLIFGPTNEEMVTDIFRQNIKSYKDLPKNLFHVQWKFRDEIRPRFGVMRGREFLMKDAYSFDIDEASARKSYNNMYLAYIQTFRDLGVTAIPVQAVSGAIGGDLSHEFHIVANTGESEIFYDKKFDILAEDTVINLDILQSLYAAADEKHDPKNCPVAEGELVSKRGIEVGHIFYFGTKYSEAMNAVVTNENGALVPVEMGSYGIGVSRLVAAIIEANHDEKGIIWPDSVAPFKASILCLDVSDEDCKSIAEAVYQSFCILNVDVLYDDTDLRAGQKFASHDLIGSPWQIIVGRSNAKNGLVELKHRRTGEVEIMEHNVAVKKILGNISVA